jgi:hypothetical protein
MDLALHPRGEETGSDHVKGGCFYVSDPPRLLVVDPSSSTFLQTVGDVPGVEAWPFSEKDVLMETDPQLIGAVTRIVSSLIPPIVDFTRPKHHESLSRLEQSAAATLALATRAFVRFLLSAACTIQINDTRKVEATRRNDAVLLAPSHVFRALEKSPSLCMVASTLAFSHHSARSNH